MSTNIRIKKTCEFCEIEFIAKTTRTRYCSHNCNRKHYKQLKREEKIRVAEEKEVTRKVDTSIYEVISVKEFLSIKEASTLIGVSERTFYRLMKDGLVKTFKLGGRTIIKRSDIDKLFC